MIVSHQYKLWHLRFSWRICCCRIPVYGLADPVCRLVHLVPTVCTRPFCRHSTLRTHPLAGTFVVVVVVNFMPMLCSQQAAASKKHFVLFRYNVVEFFDRK